MKRRADPSRPGDNQRVRSSRCCRPRTPASRRRNTLPRRTPTSRCTAPRVRRPQAARSWRSSVHTPRTRTAKAANRIRWASVSNTKRMSNRSNSARRRSLRSGAMVCRVLSTSLCKYSVTAFIFSAHFRGHNLFRSAVIVKRHQLQRLMSRHHLRLDRKPAAPASSACISLASASCAARGRSPSG